MNFDTLFKPQSIALIGASRDTESVGYSLLSNLLQPSFTGKIFPINPKATEILHRECFPSIESISESIDTAIIAIPAPAVYEAAKAAIAKGVRAIVVISAGFKEQGKEGYEREQSLIDLCKAHDVALIGPNCLGFLNSHLGLNASFETILPKAGSIALISQSGALISSILDISNTRGIGFSKIVSVGNKAMITEEQLLPYLFNDPETQVIAIYTEHLNHANALIDFMQQNLKSTQPKPVIVLKAGVTSEGMQASSSHTGSLAGSDLAYESLFTQAGMIRVHSMDELLTTAHVCSTNPLPKGNRLAILTNAGGPGILTTDAASRSDLQLAHLSDESQKALRDILPPNAHPANPIDLLGDARSDRYEQALRIVMNDPGVDSVIVIVTPQTMTDIPETAAGIIQVRNDIQKPVVASFIGSRQIDPGKFLLAATHLAHNLFPEQLILAMHHLTKFSQSISQAISNTAPEIHSISLEGIAMPERSHRKLLDTGTVFEILKRAGLPVVRSVLAQSENEAAEKAKLIGTDMAFKIVSPDISHKTDVGGVLLHVKPEDAKVTFQTIINNIRTHMPQARTDGVLMTEMIIGEGAEFFLGIKREEGLGTLLLVGLGGIYVELLKDIAARFTPVNRAEAVEMIHQLKAQPLLDGLRGKPPLDEEALIQMILQLSNLAESFPQMKELDINPVFVREKGQGAVIVDARIILH